MRRIIIFGMGSIGRRHAQILRDDPKYKLFAYRSGNSSARNELGLEELHRWADIKRLKPEIAFITNPTNLHVRTAIKCALSGMNLFIEKPLSHNLKGLDLLESICRRNRLTCYTAYCLRFHPVIKKVRELVRGKKIYHARVVCSSYLPEWRPGQDLKNSYSMFNNKGGGVLLDLSHELDYIKYIFGGIKNIEGVHGKKSNVTHDSEDFADMILTLDNGFKTTLHLNIFSRFNERSIKVDFDGGYLTGDLLTGKVEYLFRGKRRIFRLKVDRDEYLKEEIAYFLNNIGNKAIMNNLQESKKLLKKILEFRNG